MTFSTDRFWFGGDYNPEQWPETVWDEDVRLMTRAGVTVATVGVFSWSRLQPAPGEWDFGWLDDVLGRLHAAGIGVDLATATASPPPWLVHEHPEILPVTADGVRLSGGSRQHYSPHSPVYRAAALELVTALAERYGRHPALVAWHVNNEYACHVNRCYGEDAAQGFRRWLAARYGSIDALNAAWGTDFWSQRYSDFEQIDPPRTAPYTPNPTQSIDFDRFSSDAFLELYRAEAAVVRAASPGIPVTTNFMGAFRALDYWSWAPELDVISDDSYPDPADPDAPANAALTRDLMRSLGGGAPWILMEQATSAVNWRPRNAPKAPGQNRALSFQAIGRGADGIMYFQWRQSAAGSEKFHSGMVPHGGADTRIYREVSALGAELRELRWALGTPVPARIAIVFDWDSWWALDQPSTPARLDYLAIVQHWYRAFWTHHATIDFVRAGAPLDAYDLVVAPALHVVDAAAVTVLDAHVRRGGTLVVGYQSAILDKNLRVLSGGYLGELRSTLGIRVEDFAPLVAADGSVGAPIAVDSERFGPLSAVDWTEYLHLEDAEAVARFAAGGLLGWPAITRRTLGSGSAWYVAAGLDRGDLSTVVGSLLDEIGFVDPLSGDSAEVETVTRGDAVFLINHSDWARRPVLAGHGPVDIGAHGAVVIRRS